MKIWKKYEKYLLSGEWHVHTNYTDGKNSVFEICERAKELKIPLVAFTEHVRSVLTYDFNEFLSDIEKAREEFPEMIILSGIEAKVLPDGSLDVEKEILNQVDYSIFAFHSFPRDRNLYLKCLERVIKNKYINAWAHPGLFLRMTKFELTSEELEKILRLMKKNSTLLEVNYKYKLPKKEWIKRALDIRVKIVRGNDVHGIEDLTRVTIHEFEYDEGEYV